MVSYKLNKILPFFKWQNYQKTTKAALAVCLMLFLQEGLCQTPLFDTLIHSKTENMSEATL